MKYEIFLDSHFWILLNMKLSLQDKLHSLYDQFSTNDQVLIVINADPDSIASAMAVKRLLWRKVSSVSISSINVVKRPDNLAMIKLLGVNITHLDKINHSDFNKFIIVDSQPDHNECFLKFKFDVVIDHHPDTSPSIDFQDIRPDYGATSSIMTEYLRAAKIKPSTKLATGLFYAIKTDTNNFERHTLIEDLKAFQFLFRHINVYLVRKIEQSEISADFLKYFNTSFSNMRKRKGRILLHLGHVPSPDVCVVIADFYMRMSNVLWSVVSGIYENKLIIIVRNDGLRKNAGKVVKDSFGNMGSAGGHKSTARAEIGLADLNGFTSGEDERKIQKWIIQKIESHSGKK